jgi:hypothetical protein
METLPFFHTFWNQGHDKGYELAAQLQSFIPWQVWDVVCRGSGFGVRGSGLGFEDLAVELQRLVACKYQVMHPKPETRTPNPKFETQNAGGEDSVYERGVGCQ